MAEEELSRDERERKDRDAEIAEDNQRRQVRQGVVSAESGVEEDSVESTSETEAKSEEVSTEEESVEPTPEPEVKSDSKEKSKASSRNKEE
jgi:hypothetical protein